LLEELFVKTIIIALVALTLAFIPAAAAFGCTGDLFQVKNLLSTNDASFVQDLQTVLSSYRYTENYLCFGYSEERYLKDLHKVEKIVSGQIVLNRDQPKENVWTYN